MLLWGTLPPVGLIVSLIIGPVYFFPLLFNA
nr:MAG TPA: hypothetical protein [Caudoviricetes sp.]